MFSHAIAIPIHVTIPVLKPPDRKIHTRSGDISHPRQHHRIRIPPSTAVHWRSPLAQCNTKKSELSPAARDQASRASVLESLHSVSRHCKDARQAEGNKLLPERFTFPSHQTSHLQIIPAMCVAAAMRLEVGAGCPPAGWVSQQSMKAMKGDIYRDGQSSRAVPRSASTRCLSPSHGLLLLKLESPAQSSRNSYIPYPLFVGTNRRITRPPNLRFMKLPSNLLLGIFHL